MWIMLNNSFLSFVAHRDLPNALMVRARAAGDIEAVFPTATVLHTPTGADYPYRAAIARAEAGAVIGAALAGVNYTNFKSSVPDHNRHDVYMSVWSTMHRLTEPARQSDPYPRQSSLWASSAWQGEDGCAYCGEPLDAQGHCPDCDYCEEHGVLFVRDDMSGETWCRMCEPEAFCQCGKLLDEDGSCPDVNCASYA